MPSDLETVCEIFEKNPDARIDVVSESGNVALSPDILPLFTQFKLKYAHATQQMLLKLKFVVDVTVEGFEFPMEIEGDETLFPALQSAMAKSIASQFKKTSSESDVDHFKRQAKMLCASKALDTLYESAKDPPFSYDPNLPNRLSSQSVCGFLFISDEKLDEIIKADQLMRGHHDYSSYGTENGVALICPHRGKGCEHCLSKDEVHPTEDHYLMWRVESLAEGKRHHTHSDQLVIVMPNFVYGTFQGDNINPLRGWITAAVTNKLMMMTGLDLPFREKIDVELVGYGETNLNVSRASAPETRCAFEVGLVEAFAFMYFRDVYSEYVQAFKLDVCQGAMDKARENEEHHENPDLFADYVKMITEPSGSIYIPSKNDDLDGEVKEHSFLTGLS